MGMIKVEEKVKKRIEKAKDFYKFNSLSQTLEFLIMKDEKVRRK